MLYLTMLLMLFATPCCPEESETRCITQNVSCFEKWTGRIHKPQRTPPQVVRVINQVVMPDGSIRTDKGSGVIVRNENNVTKIITAAHIFRDGAKDIRIILQDGQHVLARLEKKSESWDAVLLGVSAAINIPPLHWAKNVPVKGDATVAWGFGPDGIIAGQNGFVVDYVQKEGTEIPETIKTTGRAREGDSGGPVLNAQGELVGLLWGTDGRYTYSTSSQQLQRLFPARTPPMTTPLMPLPQNLFGVAPNKDTPPQEYPTKDSPKTPALSKNLAHAAKEVFKPLIETFMTKTTVALFGLGSPAVLLLYVARRHLLRNLKNRNKNKPAETIQTKKQPIVLNDQYADELNSLYQLSGHSNTADATLGRLYDIKLRDAEQSSSQEMADLAKKLRKQVSEQFLRIHSSNPAPTEQ